MTRTTIAAAFVLLSTAYAFAGQLVEIPPGSFDMGSTDAAANWDEQPVHRVTISRPLLMGEHEVTADEFQQFKPDAVVTRDCEPIAAGMSWYDAVAYCEWLSKKEGKPYRLPTEAEWEFAARSGKIADILGTPQWCLDWYGEYPATGEAQTDPTGVESGMCRVIRGGPVDEKHRNYPPEKYKRVSSRCGMPPAFGALVGQAPPPEKYKDDLKSFRRFGQHHIGFRVVQAPMPQTPPTPVLQPYARQGIKQSTTQAAATFAPDPDKPYYRKRRMLPTPPEDCDAATIAKAGLHPSFRFHNHSPSMEVLPNGDVMLIIYTSVDEYEPEVSLMSARLRFGADEWDSPWPMFDTPGANDHAPLLWNDNGTIRFFWGNAIAVGSYPFNGRVSTDNGATWSEVFFPHITGEIGPTDRPQPINTAFRDAKGTMYVPTDESGAESILWASDDDGKTWHDTLGRSAGRHTTYVQLKDGRILGMGGKNSQIDGYMPKAISSDGGRTFEKSRTPFPALAGGQRPCILRLKSSRLVFFGDYQNKAGQQPPTIHEHGTYVAWSDDEGANWHIKNLIGTQPHSNQYPSLGYCVARQAPNGVIHLITSVTRPALHFEMNEAWILDANTPVPDDDTLMRDTATAVSDVTQHGENYPNGKPRITWSAGKGDDGRYLLEGDESWLYPDGQLQHRASYKLGRKVGDEIYLAPDGKKLWEWHYKDDGSADYVTYDALGKPKTRSTWRNMKMIDPPATTRGG